MAPVMIGMIATNYSIGMGLSLMGVAYILCGLIPALFIREKCMNHMWNNRQIINPASAMTVIVQTFNYGRYLKNRGEFPLRFFIIFRKKEGG